MAQTVKIFAESSLNSLIFIVLENGSTATFNYNGPMAGSAFVPSPSSLDLEDLASTIAVQIPQMGLSAQFSFTQITAFTINGVDQIDQNSPLVADLRQVTLALAPYFFVSGVASISLDYPVTAATTELDFSSIGQANIIQLTSADSAMTISRILNIPANREIKILPPLAATLTVARTTQVAMSDNWQVLSSANHACEGGKGEAVWVEKFQSATWTICQVTRFLTNLL